MSNRKQKSILIIFIIASIALVGLFIWGRFGGKLEFDDEKSSESMSIDFDDGSPKVSASYAGKNISFLPVNFREGAKAERNSEKYVWKDIYEDTDLVYERVDGGIKETIVLKSEKAPQSFSFRFNVPEGIVFEKDLDNNIVFFNDNRSGLVADSNAEQRGGGFFRLVGREIRNSLLAMFLRIKGEDNIQDTRYQIQDTKYLYHIPPPVIWDSIGKATTGVEIKILSNKENNSDFLITFKPNEQWLNSPERVYPIYLDPSIVHDTEAEFDAGKALNRVESLAGPKVQLPYHELPADEYTVGLWHMNNDWNDSSGNGNNGTASGGATFTTSAKLGSHAGSFDGDGDYVKCGDNNLPTGANSRTVEFWTKRSVSSNFTYYPYPFFYGTKTQYQGFGLYGYIDTTDIYFYGHSYDFDTGIDLDDTLWHHIAVTFDGTYLRTYKDGVLISTTDRSLLNTVLSDLDFTIGGFYVENQYWDGIIDEVRISNRALTPEEIKADAERRPYGVYTSSVLDLTADITSIDSISWTESITPPTAPSGWTKYKPVIIDNTQNSSALSNYQVKVHVDYDSNMQADFDDLKFTNSAGTNLDYWIEEKSDGVEAEVWVEVDSITASAVTTIFMWYGNGGASAGSDSSVCLGGVHDGYCYELFDDFSDGDYTNNPTWTVVNGQWNVESEELSVETTTDWAKIVSPDSYTNFVYEYDFKGDSSGRKGGMFRYVDSSNFHHFVCGSNVGGCAFRTTGGTGYSSSVYSYTIVNDVWYHVKIIAEGYNYKIYLNDVLLGEENDTSFASGKIGFKNEDWAHAHFDNVFVRKYTSPEPIAGVGGDIELQTRTGADNTPDDGDWEEWKPVTSETQILSLDSDNDNWEGRYDGYTKLLLHNDGTDGSTSFPDKSLFTKTITANGNAQIDTAQSKFGGASGLFDGTGDYLTLADSDDWYFSNGNFTIDFWVRFASVAGIQTLIAQRGAAFSWEVILYASRLSFWTENDPAFGLDSSLYPSINTWYHIAVVRNGGTITMYADGTSVGSNSNAGTTSFTNVNSVLGIGMRTASIDYSPLNGWLDEIRISKGIARWTSNFTAPTSAYDNPGWIVAANDTTTKIEGTGSLKSTVGAPQVDSNTVALWHLEETGGTGAYIKDSTANVNHGTPTGTTVVDGWFGKARSFNGTSDYVGVANNSSLNPTSAISVSVWFKNTATSGGLVVKRSGNNGYRLTYGGSVLYWSVGNGSTLVQPSTSGYNDGNWHFVVGTYDSSNAILYVDGVLKATSALTGPMTNTATALLIGDSDDQGKLTGTIDEVRISNVARTAEEIAEAYRAGRDYRLSRTISSADLSSNTKLPFYIAADRPGTYLEAAIGETDYSMYQTDSNTVGLWHLDEEGQRPPSDIPNLMVWLKADGITGIANGAQFGTWNDSSGNGNNFTQATGSRQPTYITNVLNGKPVVRVSAASSQTMTNATNFPAPISVIYVTRLTGGANARMLSGLSNNWLLGFHGGTKQDAYFEGWVNDGATAADTNWYIYSTVITGAGTNSKVYESGILFGDNQSGITGPNGLSLSGHLGSSEFSNGDIAELVVYNRAISDTERLQVESYLTNKYFGSGDTYIKDSSGSGNHGTPTGTTFTQGKIGKARSFNGSSDYVNVGSDTSIDDLPTGDVTWEAWFNPDWNTDAYKYIFTKAPTSTDGYRIGVDTGANKVYVAIEYSTTYIREYFDATLNQSQWYHIAVTFNGAGDKKARLYIDGVYKGVSNAVSGSYKSDAASNQIIGANYTTELVQFFDGTIDEVRISNVARSADYIRQAYQYGLRTHPITIDFVDSLNSANLIADINDTSFTLNNANSMAENLFVGDKVIVRENYDGTEYIAQGTVTAVTASTGAVTVSSWDAGSTFPSGGYTVNATVFKWQREYWDITDISPADRNALTKLNLRVLDASEGFTFWLDDIKQGGAYLTDPSGESVSSTAQRYMQYRVIFSAADAAVTPYLSQVTVNYSVNNKPTGTFVSAAEKTDGSGTVDISIEVDDLDDEDCKAKIEYTADETCASGWVSSPNVTLAGPAAADYNDSGGVPDVTNANAYQVGSGTNTRIITSSGSNTVAFDWESATDAPTGDGTYCLRLTANDDTDDQETPATQTLTIDNVGPSGLTALTASYTKNSATLSWTAVTESHFDHYEIWYGTSQVDVQGRIGTALEWDGVDDGNMNTKSTTSTTITDLTHNTAYFFKIWASDTYGNPEETVDDISVTTNDPPVLHDGTTDNTLPALTQATDGTGKITITFRIKDYEGESCSAGTVYYQVDGGDWNAITDGDITGTKTELTSASDMTGALHTLTWDNSKEYIDDAESANLKIDFKANDSHQDSASWGMSPAGFTLDNLDPSGLTALSVTQMLSSQAYLSWSAVTETNWDHYEIWYGTGQVDVQGRTGSALEWDGNDDGNMNTKSTTSTIITGLSRNTTYYFKIWAIDSFTNEATVADATDTTEPAACPICQKYSPLAAGYRLITDCYGGNDSDDNNAGTYPTEICDNGIDDNSNNLIDCADTSACPTGTSCGTNKQCEDSLCYAGLDYMEYANDAAAQAAYVTSVAWLSGYSTRKKLTIDHNKIDSALSNFPVLVKLTSSNFDFSKANNDGFDIRFTSSNGTTLLKYEREQHDSSGQKAEYWVKIPSISADVNTDFYIYYRTTDTADGAEPSNVWDSNFQGVYHMTNLNDSSGYGRNGSAVGSITQAEGKIYKSQYDNATYGSRINLGSGSHWALGTMTLEIYGNMTGGDTYICKDWGTGYALYMDGSNHAVMTLTDQANGRKVTGTTDVKNNFHYIAGTYDGTTIKLFVNGVSEGTPYNYGFTYSGSAELYIGGNNFGGGGIGYWDEVRISNISRGSAWIKASYHSENDSLLTYGKDTPLQSYSESSIKQQGSYSLKGIALGTDSLNDTLTRTVSPTIDLSNKNTIKFDIRASRTGSNIKIGIHDSGGTTTEITPNIISANTWQTVEWDISGVSNANKDAIDQIKITITNADSDNTFYIDNMRAH